MKSPTFVDYVLVLAIAQIRVPQDVYSTFGVLYLEFFLLLAFLLSNFIFLAGFPLSALFDDDYYKLHETIDHSYCDQGTDQNN